MNQITNSSRKSSHQTAFTLIELIMVIVVLGILVAFALPKFADLADSADVSSLEDARNAVKSASAITHAACLADPGCNASAPVSSVNIEGQPVTMVYGYPSREGIQLAADLDGFFVVADEKRADMIIAVSDQADAPCFAYTIASMTTDAENPAISAPKISPQAMYQANGDGPLDDTCM